MRLGRPGDGVWPRVGSACPQYLAHRIGLSQSQTPQHSQGAASEKPCEGKGDPVRLM